MKDLIINLRQTVNAVERSNLLNLIQMEINRLELKEDTVGVIHDLMLLRNGLKLHSVTSNQICEIETLLLKTKRLFK